MVGTCLAMQRTNSKLPVLLCYCCLRECTCKCAQANVVCVGICVCVCTYPIIFSERWIVHSQDTYMPTVYTVSLSHSRTHTTRKVRTRAISSRRFPRLISKRISSVILLPCCPQSGRRSRSSTRKLPGTVHHIYTHVLCINIHTCFRDVESYIICAHMCFQHVVSLVSMHGVSSIQISVHSVSAPARCAAQFNITAYVNACIDVHTHRHTYINVHCLTRFQ